MTVALNSKGIFQDLDSPCSVKYSFIQMNY